MSNKEKILDDVARMAGGAIGTISGLRGQINEEIRLRIDEMALRMDLVPRAEFERMESMLKQARIEQNELIKRIEKLEQQIAPKTKAS